MAKNKEFKLSDMTKNLSQSAIRAASTRCAKQKGYNLGQGLSELPVPALLKAAVSEAVEADHNQYSACEGYYKLREKIAQKCETYNKIKLDPTTELVVTSGATGAFVIALAALLNPGDEVVVFEPAYGYHTSLIKVFNGVVKGVKINLVDFSFSLAELRAAITDKTKAIVICTPANPCGKVFTRDELIQIGELALEKKLWVITDEIYEYILYPGHTHFSLASLEKYKANTLTISGFSKTYSMTGWRLGYISGPASVVEKMALVNDLFYVCPATPLQYAVVKAFDLPESYYDLMRATYLCNRDLVVEQLQQVGFHCYVPEGAYYLMVEVGQTRFKNCDDVFTKFLDEANVSIVPGNAFYVNPQDGERTFRVCFGLTEQKLAKALAAVQQISR